ncbi:glycosyltransferase family 4 protein [Ornithinimicrobium faecis]|uniref:D-inositol 3-phosphate glycosyltransferase n=1 Tax=Ornithinimicrobium faecis TaxID=2934158 RepID=A0ABY4YNV4_9MICO|nr:glycosyltransferase family 4 protein [Ornithinimicrobium sp. HY1793]USQ78374.1 glycosyltransferase family 4 protein [Ornithinimicrobium sp. HY1793]
MSRILMVTGVVAGGVGRHVEQLSRSLVELGHTVVVACPPVVAARFGLSEAGAQHIPLEIDSKPRPQRDRRTVAALREAMADVDVVHAHGVRAGALSVLARTGDRPPLVVTTHNAAPEGRLAAVVHWNLDRVVCRGADLILGVSQDLCEMARERGARDVGVAVVPAATAEPARDRAEVRRELGLQDDTPLAVAVGRLAPQKGFDRLLDALVAAGTTAEDALVVIAGEGPQAEALQRRIDRADLPVRLLGHRSDVPDLLATADVVISAARWEGQPVWLQEALSVGAPVVATDVGGTEQVLDGAGLLVPGDDAEALGAALTALLQDEVLREDLRAKALVRAAELPTAEDAAQAALTAYRRALSTTESRDVD